MFGERLKEREDLTNEITNCEKLITSCLTSLENLKRVVRADNANRYQLWHTYKIRIYNMKTVQDSSVCPDAAIKRIRDIQDLIFQTNKKLLDIHGERDIAIALENKARSEARQPTLVPEKVIQTTSGDDASKKKFKFKLLSLTKQKGDLINIFGDANEAPNAETHKAAGVGSALHQLMLEEEIQKEIQNSRSYWLCEGIEVEVIKTVGTAGNKNGFVLRMLDEYTAEVKMFGSPKTLVFDQKQLQTVIPHSGKLVRVVNRGYRGLDARVLSVNKVACTAAVQIEKGVYAGRVIEAIPYKDICKVHM